MSSTDIDFGPDWIKNMKANPTDAPNNNNVFSSQNSMTSSQHSGTGGAGGLSALMSNSMNNNSSSQSPLLSNVERLMNEHRQTAGNNSGGGNIIDSVFGGKAKNQNTTNAHKPFRPHLAKNRYGREDMLALYHSIVDDEGMIERPAGDDFIQSESNPCKVEKIYK